MNIVLSGSIAFDYLMTFPGKFKDHILPEHLDHLSLSFLVDNLIRRPGGVATNIAYTLAMLGERPLVMATVGEDFQPQLAALNKIGVDTSGIRIIPGVPTASFFANTDESNAQIASFYTGAMAHATELSFKDLETKPDLAVISPNDPTAMVKYCQECVELGIPYLYDPSQQTVRLSRQEMEIGIKTAHALFCNDYEYAMIEGKTGWNLDDIRSMVDLLVITRGKDGSDIYRHEEYVHVPVAKEMKICDPTGVGDAFRAGFLKGLANDLSMERCGQLGAVAATYCLESDSPQGHFFNLAEFVARFRKDFDDHGEMDSWL
ncbi:MAG: carbohydrate kinase family protein [Anaerolineales bacterium]|nr:carbohydrate kinase family protein [Anaerolineales bacterium]